MCTYMCMGTKTISIMDDAYEILSRNKMKSESFSGVIRRLAKSGDIMAFAGAWKKMSDKEITEMKKDIMDLRKKSTKDLLRQGK